MDEKVTVIHCRRELVEKIHSDGDQDCKACLKSLNGLISICNHLSRRYSCRDYYCNELLPFIDNSTKLCQKQTEQSDQYGLEGYKKLPFQVGNRQEWSSRSPSSLPSSPSPSSNVNMAKMDSVTGKKGHNGVNSLENEENPSERVIVGPEDELISKAYLIRNPVQCPKCRKIFRGKTPAVAYNNHRRNLHCPVAGETRLSLKGKNTNTPVAKKPEKLLTIEPKVALKNGYETKKKFDLLKTSSDVQYYCKLCPSKKAISRVSLALHLTLDHKIPPVSDYNEGDLTLTCQTCSNKFFSKYIYNQHRYKCDLKSPYIGILLNGVPKKAKNLKASCSDEAFETKVSYPVLASTSSLESSPSENYNDSQDDKMDIKSEEEVGRLQNFKELFEAEEPNLLDSKKQPMKKMSSNPTQISRSQSLLKPRPNILSKQHLLNNEKPLTDPKVIASSDPENDVYSAQSPHPYSPQLSLEPTMTVTPVANHSSHSFELEESHNDENTNLSAESASHFEPSKCLESVDESMDTEISESDQQMKIATSISEISSLA